MLENSDRLINLGKPIPGTFKTPLLINKVEAFNLINNGGPTANCQLSSVDNFNEIIDNLSVNELTAYINNILYINTLKLIIITNKYRNEKFKESMIKVSKYRIYIFQETKIKNRNQYIYLLTKKIK